jgi:hypothetical protein
VTVPEIPAVAVATTPAATAGSTDATDLAAILDDDAQIDVLRQDVEVHRQAIVDRHGVDGIAPVMLALSRLSGLTQQMSGLTEQMSIEVRFIRRHFGEA